MTILWPKFFQFVDTASDVLVFILPIEFQIVKFSLIKS
ncbi:hypothetical protein HMPREF0299_7516 [Corynebacterium matruchotii ATCC 14266]|jgi:hypothetical protein|uniref:Uncharacterized protein n=1 Tax=Corynebacterium matruchotii ATCC 14266 TaxID=553207 RepID=E0DDJ9_9CORY|nr:hypothetical protein HMPREF0299_7516 [Corynebacterium matruchotii ATCC 14266]